jgi:CHAT domain-containing protein
MAALSGCQTGLGKEIKGEGLMGLTRGFMHAGAARVIVSLWEVEEGSSVMRVAGCAARVSNQSNDGDAFLAE